MTEIKPNSRAKKLNELTDKALDKLGEVMDMSPENQVLTKAGEVIDIIDSRIISSQVTAASKVISAQMQADANALRAVESGKLEELLALLKAGTVPSAERQQSGES